MRVTPFSYLEQKDEAVAPPVGPTNLYILSDFITDFSGTTVNRIFKLDKSTGVLDTTFNNYLVNNVTWGAAGGGYGAVMGDYIYVSNKDTLSNLKVFKIHKDTGVVSASSAITFGGDILGVIPYGSYVYVLGTFTSPNSRIARLNASDLSDASSSTFFGSGFNGTTLGKSSLIYGGYLYVGGDFSTYDGTSSDNIAKIDLSTGNIDTTFATNSPGFNSHIRAMDIYNEKLYIGGFFTSPANRVWSLNLDGTENTTFTAGITSGFNNRVRDIAVDGLGHIGFSAQGTTYNGTNYGNMTVLNTDGTVYSGFHTNAGTGQQDGSFIGRLLYNTEDDIWYIGQGGGSVGTITFNGTNYAYGVAGINADGTFNSVLGSTISDGVNSQVKEFTIG